MTSKYLALAIAAVIMLPAKPSAAAPPQLPNPNSHGAAIRTINFLDLGTRVNLYENGWPVQDDARQSKYRVETLFGPESNWVNVNPWDLAPRFSAYNGKLALYSGGADGTGEKEIRQHLPSLVRRQR